MSLLQIAVRCLVAYAYLLLSVRLSGKRVVAQATPFDFVLALVIGDLIDDALWAEVSMSRFFVAVSTLVLCDCFLKLLSGRFDRLYLWLQSPPAIVLRNGIEDASALRREQLNEFDLAALLRVESIEDRTRIRLAVLERDHGLSLLEQEWAKGLAKKDLEMLTEKRQ